MSETPTPNNIHTDAGRNEPLILEQVAEIKEKTKQTGVNHSIKVDKRQFIEEVPKAGSDPRMAFTKDKFIFSTERFTTMTVGELRELCLKARGASFALQKAMEVEGFADKVEVTLYTQDVNRLRQLGQ